jgi:hypothetical protein
MRLFRLPELVPEYITHWPTVVCTPATPQVATQPEVLADAQPNEVVVCATTVGETTTFWHGILQAPAPSDLVPVPQPEVGLTRLQVTVAIVVTATGATAMLVTAMLVTATPQLQPGVVLGTARPPCMHWTTPVPVLTQVKV